MLSHFNLVVEDSWNAAGLRSVLKGQQSWAMDKHSKANDSINSSRIVIKGGKQAALGFLGPLCLRVCNVIIAWEDFFKFYIPTTVSFPSFISDLPLQLPSPLFLHLHSEGVRPPPPWESTKHDLSS